MTVVLDYCPKCCRVDALERHAAGGKRRCRYCAYAPDGAVPAAPVDPDARRDLVREGHLRAIAVWTVLGGVCMLATLPFLPAVAEPVLDRHQLYGDDRALATTAAAALLLALGIASVAAGWGLWGFRPWGRGLYGILGLLMLVAQTLGLAGSILAGGEFVVGAIQIAWTIACLWIVVSGRSAEVCSEEQRGYRLMGKARARFWSSPFLFAPVLAAAVCVFGSVGAILS